PPEQLGSGGQFRVRLSSLPDSSLNELGRLHSPRHYFHPHLVATDLAVADRNQSAENASFRAAHEGLADPPASLFFVFFALPTWARALLILAIIGGATALGYAIGRYLRQHQEKLREPFGVLQGALLGVVGLILAFGMSLAVGRYEDRRAVTVDEANAIGTSYL